MASWVLNGDADACHECPCIRWLWLWMGMLLPRGLEMAGRCIDTCCGRVRISEEQDGEESVPWSSSRLPSSRVPPCLELARRDETLSLDGREIV